MPKIINHELKRKEIIQYAWQSISNRGAKGSTVRQIAKLSNMTPGQIRYYFPNHSELLNAVMSEVEIKVKRRIEKIISDNKLQTIDMVNEILLTVLPIDDERLADMEVWMAFRYDLHEYGQNTLDDGLDTLCHKIINILNSKNLLKPNTNIRLSTIKLHALIDGLALHKLLNPDDISNKDIENIVRTEINTLTNTKEDKL